MHVTMLRRLFSLISLAAAGVLASPLGGQGQVITGRLVEQIERTPIDGAMVWLLDEADQPMAQVLTNQRGAFMMTAPTGGFFKLRADRIGHASAFTDVFQVMANDTIFVPIEAAVQAIQLAAIDVEADRQCRIRPEAGQATAVVWEEARKALAAAAWTADAGSYMYELNYHNRDLDRDARRIEREETRRSSVLRQRTFVSRPAKELMEEGFVQRDEGDFVYYAPDADVLMSDEFLDTHCLELRAGQRESEGLLGLGFSPIRGRGVPDIDGTLWIDPETSELRWLDFRYINLESGLRDDNVGGRVEFQPLPSGPWIVRRWSIRMPYMQTQRPMGTTEVRTVLAGLHETGAQVTQVRDRGGDLLLEFETGMVVGSVTSRYGIEPLEGATVRMVGSNVETQTDADGAYQISGLEDGEYQITFRHPSLDSLGFQSEPVPVEVVRGKPAVVHFTAPNEWEMLSSICRGEEVAEGTAALVGWVRETSTGETLPGAQVTVLWTGYEISASQASTNVGNDDQNVIVRGNQQGVQATTNADGMYVTCGIPTNTTVDVQATWASVEGRSVRIRIPAETMAEHRDVTIRVGTGTPGRADTPGRVTPGRNTVGASGESVEETARKLGQDIRRRAGPRLRVEERTTPVLELWFCVQGGRREATDAVVSGCSGAVLLVDGVIAQEGMGQQGVAADRMMDLLSGRRIDGVRVLTANEAEFELGELGENGAVFVDTSPVG